MGNSKFVTAQEAINAIKPGSIIFVGESCGEPQTLVEALVEAKERLKGSHIVDSRRITGSKYAQLYDYFHIITLHVTPDNQEAVHRRKVDFLPVRLSEAHTLFHDSNLLPIDAALVQVSPPDIQGYCSLGVSVGYTLDAALSARMAIAEVNKQMPRTYGRNQLHIDMFDYLIESSRPLLEYPYPDIGEVEMKVAANVQQLIDDGSVLSIGIGAVPEAVVRSLEGKRKLGIHTGMICDGFITPIEKKIITNERKQIDKGKTVAALALGTKKLFEFMNENPVVKMHPYSYTHDVKRIAQFDNFVFISSAVAVDLTGQVSAESIGDIQISTIGGQADFIRGATLSKGGKSIIALTSTTRDGKSSRIVPQFKEGTVVSTPRYDIHYVVTEHGIAELRGKTLSQRINALISVAHPKLRDELYQATFSI